PRVGIELIDHVVCNVELGKMNELVDFYARILGFDQLVHFRDDQISSDYSALMSKVMWDGQGRVKFPINEPAPGKRKSQIDEYLEFYRSPGVQHIAMASDDISAAHTGIRAASVAVLHNPGPYLDAIGSRAVQTPLHARPRKGPC